MEPTQQSVANHEPHEPSDSAQKLLSAQEAIDEFERELERIGNGVQSMCVLKIITRGTSCRLNPNKNYIITMRMWDIAPTEINKRISLWDLRPAILTAQFYLPKGSAFTSESMRTVPRDYYLQSSFYRIAIHRDPARTTATFNTTPQPSNSMLPRPFVSIKEDPKQ